MFQVWAHEKHPVAAVSDLQLHPVCLHNTPIPCKSVISNNHHLGCPLNDSPLNFFCLGHPSEVAALFDTVPVLMTIN